MSINSSMYIGLTGMKSNTQAINVIGDNIANMNTVGFKASRAVFQEMLGATLNGGGAMGGGVGVVDVEKLFAQGTLVQTGVTTDMAIAGNGFFALQGNMNGMEGNFFSRAGQFHRDNEGFLVNPQGLKLLGYPADDSGNVSASLLALQIDDAPMPPKATSEVGLSVNLNPEQALKEADFDETKPGETSEFSSSVTVYDSLGRSHEVHVFYDKAEDGSWSYTAMVDSKGIDGTEGFTKVGEGTLSFDEKGQLDVAADAIELKFTPDGLSEQTVTMDMTGTTKFKADSATNSQTQNGSPSGTFQSFNIDANGEITGVFSNGEQRKLGEVALARFKSPDGLQVMGSGLFGGSMDSGSVIMGRANSAGMGQLVSGSLEQSTVDLATEFTNMIVAQRGYQANSRSITTADQMMQEAVSLKR